MPTESVLLSSLGVILMLKAICCSGATLEEGKNLVSVIIKKVHILTIVYDPCLCNMTYVVLGLYIT